MLTLAAGDLAGGPADSFAGPARALNGSQLTLFVRTQGAAIEIMRASPAWRGASCEFTEDLDQDYLVMRLDCPLHDTPPEDEPEE